MQIKKYIIIIDNKKIYFLFFTLYKEIYIFFQHQHHIKTYIILKRIILYIFKLLIRIIYIVSRIVLYFSDCFNHLRTYIQFVLFLTYLKCLY